MREESWSYTFSPPPLPLFLGVGVTHNQTVPVSQPPSPQTHEIHSFIFFIQISKTVYKLFQNTIEYKRGNPSQTQTGIILTSKDFTSLDRFSFFGFHAQIGWSSVLENLLVIGGSTSNELLWIFVIQRQWK
jgi:hypothetical protein